MLEADTEEQFSGSENGYKSVPEGEYFQDHGGSEDEHKDEDLIPSLSLCVMGFKAVLRSDKPLKSFK